MFHVLKKRFDRLVKDYIIAFDINFQSSQSVLHAHRGVIILKFLTCNTSVALALSNIRFLVNNSDLTSSRINGRTQRQTKLRLLKSFKSITPLRTKFYGNKVKYRLLTKFVVL